MVGELTSLGVENEDEEVNRVMNSIGSSRISVTYFRVKNDSNQSIRMLETTTQILFPLSDLSRHCLI